MIRGLVLCLLMLLVVGCSSEHQALQVADLVRVIDGDTIVVKVGGLDERVRLIGVDTPEWRQPGFDAARKFTQDLLGDGRIILERDQSERDKYGRLLRYVYSSTGIMVNDQLIRAGLADLMTIEPDTKYRLGTVTKRVVHPTEMGR